jgi:hypothetical protein
MTGAQLRANSESERPASKSVIRPNSCHAGRLAARVVAGATERQSAFARAGPEVAE